MHANASQLVLVLLLIWWKSGANLLSQSCSVLNAKPITSRHSNENRSMKMRLIIPVTQTTYAVVKLKPEKYSGLNRIWAHELCHTGAVLCQLSYQAIWELATLKVCNIPIDGEENCIPSTVSNQPSWCQNHRKSAVQHKMFGLKESKLI